MHFKNKWKIEKLVQILYICGVVLLFIAFVLITKNNFTVGFICIFIAVLMMIPNSWKFIIKEIKSNERWTIYWFGKFLALFLALVVCIVFFIHRATQG
jgi:membrane-bound ClpP family serine protease